jgi:hypothetical protein
MLLILPVIIICLLVWRVCCALEDPSFYTNIGSELFCALCVLLLLPLIMLIGGAFYLYWLLNHF